MSVSINVANYCYYCYFQDVLLDEMVIIDFVDSFAMDIAKVHKTMLIYNTNMNYFFLLIFESYCLFRFISCLYCINFVLIIIIYRGLITFIWVLLAPMAFCQAKPVWLMVIGLLKYRIMAWLNLDNDVMLL